jgi:acyl-CoA reductase-like NAD-dependent aldehyde dehydrogenase
LKKISLSEKTNNSIEMAYEEVMNRAHNAFNSGKTRDIDFRRKQLQALLQMYEENRDEMAAALAADLR